MPEVIEKRVKIEKVDEENRLVFGWLSVIEEDGKEVFDYHEDAIQEPELEKSAYGFNLDARSFDVEHDYTARGHLVESMVFTKAKQKALGIDLKKVGWWGGVYVDDDEAWEGVKSGKYDSFSIAGVAVREEIDA